MMLSMFLVPPSNQIVILRLYFLWIILSPVCPRFVFLIIDCFHDSQLVTQFWKKRQYIFAPSGRRGGARSNQSTPKVLSKF